MYRGKTDQKSRRFLFLFSFAFPFWQQFVILQILKTKQKKSLKKAWQNKCCELHSFNCCDAIIFWERNIAQLCSPQGMLKATGSQFPVKFTETASLTGVIIDLISFAVKDKFHQLLLGLNMASVDVWVHAIDMLVPAYLGIDGNSADCIQWINDSKAFSKLGTLKFPWNGVSCLTPRKLIKYRSIIDDSSHGVTIFS